MAITKTQWEGFSDKQQWDIKVALRGPDSFYGETLKWFTTSVIRGAVRKVFRVGGTVNEDLKLVILPRDTSDYTKDKEKWNCHHFIDHVLTAACHLGIPTLSIPQETWSEVMKGHHYSSAAAQILKHIEDHPDDYAFLTKQVTELRRHYTEYLLRERY